VERAATGAESERGWSCDVVRPMLPAAAIGALDRAETDEVARHLLHCRACRIELDRYVDTVERLGFAAAQLDPPVTLKTRLFRDIDPPQPLWLRPRISWVASLAAVLLALLLAGNLAVELHLVGKGSLSGTPVAQTAATTQPQLVWYDLISTSGGSATGTLCAQQSGALAWLIVEDLPPLPAGKTYQAWLTTGDRRVSAGTFVVDNRGRGFLTIHLTQPITSYTVLGVTDEPMGGSPEPTGARLLGGSL